MLREIESQHLNEAELHTLLGQDLAVAGYRHVLNQAGDYGHLVELLEKGRGGDLAAGLMEASEKNVTVDAANRAKRQKARSTCMMRRSYTAPVNLMETVETDAAARMPLAARGSSGVWA